mgnify:CR=1 FL=1
MAATQVLLRRSSPCRVPLFVVLSLFAATAASRAQSSVPEWQRWEVTLPAAGIAYSNPYLVLVPVEFYRSGTLPAPGSPTQATGFGFWDGGTIFRIRGKFQLANPAVAETWWWRTNCPSGSLCDNDAGLDNKSGSFTVNPEPSNETRVLYKKGAVRVSSSGPFLVHQNAPNDPFFWLGDTAWYAGWRSSNSQWTNYVANRAAKNFSVVQMSVPIGDVVCPETQPKDVGSPAVTPFDPTTAAEPCSTVDIAYPNDNKKAVPAFWQRFEGKIQQANDGGLLVVLIGLMESTVGKKTDGTIMRSMPVPTQSASTRFVKYLTARLAGNHVVFSPGFDGQPTVAQIDWLPANGTCSSACAAGGASFDRACRTRCIGLEIKNATLGQIGRPLVTNHAGGSCKNENPCRGDKWFGKLKAEDWLDFVLFQSGQASTEGGLGTPLQIQLVTERARERPLNLYTSVTPTKPVVNGEGIYDNFGTGSSVHYSADRALQVGYLSMLSGSFGYSLGVGGVWDWSSPVNSVLNSPSSTRMAALGQLFRSLPWSRIQPEHSRILNQPLDTPIATCAYPPADLCSWKVGSSPQCNCTQNTLSFAFARDSIGRFALAYFPAGRTTLQFDNFNWTDYPNLQFFWFDPRQGCTRQLVSAGCSGGTCPPTCVGTSCTQTSLDSTKDWILVMKLSTVGGTGTPFPAACP